MLYNAYNCPTFKKYSLKIDSAISILIVKVAIVFIMINSVFSLIVKVYNILNQKNDGYNRPRYWKECKTPWNHGLLDLYIESNRTLNQIIS